MKMAMPARQVGKEQRNSKKSNDKMMVNCLLSFIDVTKVQKNGTYANRDPFEGHYHIPKCILKK